MVSSLTAVSLLVGGCGEGDGDGDGDDRQAAPVIDPGDGGSYAPSLDAADFVDVIDNPYLPLRPGARWVYEGVEDGETERVEVVVTDERRQILGISAVVVRDTVTVDGELVEDTFDWFAQDRDGNVWYLGEDSKEYEGGKVVSTEGSWEAGVDGAQPGVVMLAEPEMGDEYRQEFYAGEAEDVAKVVGLDDTIDVPFGTFNSILVTEDRNPLEPRLLERKYYAPGIGVVYEELTSGGEGYLELVDVKKS